MCLWPTRFAAIAWVFAMPALVMTATRWWWGWTLFFRERIMSLRAALVLLCLSLPGAAAAQPSMETVPVGRFSEGTLVGWEKKAFQGETTYSFAIDPDVKSTVLQANADTSASGMFRRIKIDLSKTPFLNWSWKATDTFAGIDENTKGGDDFPVRIYVVVERGILGMSSLSLNYVWASQHPVGSIWPSPFTKQVRLFALDSGRLGLNEWIRHKRNLRLDLKTAFGEELSEIDAVALMTDTDNHGGRAKSFYGDVWFSAE
jgi:hypothetical protein